MSLTSTRPVRDSATLFEELKFFVAQRCPARSTIKKTIEDHGGEVVPLERQAHYLIADHLKRNNNPAGALSYTWVEESVKQGSILPRDVHTAGPSTTPIRVSQSVQPTKSTRTPFSAEDDRILWQWVCQSRRLGAKTLGNEIYKDLEKQNSRHTWQSWRDRYVKYLQNNPLDQGQETQPPPTPPSDTVNTTKKAPVPRKSRKSPRIASSGTQMPKNPSLQTQSQNRAPSPDEERTTNPEDTYGSFSEADFDEMLEQTPRILKMLVGDYLPCWGPLAETHPDHTAAEWRAFFEDVVKPVYDAKKKQQEVGVSTESDDQETAVIDVDGKPRPSRDSVLSEKESVSGNKSSSRIQQSAVIQTVSTGNTVTNLDGDGLKETSISTSTESSNYAHSKRARTQETPEAVDFITEYPRKRARFGEQHSLQTKSPRNSEPKLMSSPPSRDRTTTVKLSDDEDGEQVEDDDVDNIIGMEDSQEEDTIINLLQDGPDSPNLPTDTNSTLENTNAANGSVARSDRSDSFDPILSSAQSHAMTGRRPKSKSESAHSTPHGTSRMEQPSDARGRVQHRSNQNKKSVREQLSENNSPVTSGKARPDNRKISRPRFQRRQPTKSPQGSEGRSSIAHSPAESTTGSELEAADRIDLPRGSSPKTKPPAADEDDSVAASPNNAETQAFFDAPTHIPDLGMAEPDDGFDADVLSDADEDTISRDKSHQKTPQTEIVEIVEDESDVSDNSESLDEEAKNIQQSNEPQSEDEESLFVRQDEPLPHHKRNETIETQVIFQGEVQYPDLDFPLPDDSLSLPSPSASRTPKSSQNEDHGSETQGPETQLTDLNAWIEEREAEGFDYQTIGEALKATSLDASLAEQILPSIEATRGVPKDMRGVWTKEDDEALEGGDGRKIRRLEEKHGWRLFRERMGVLREWREGEEKARSSVG
ncbi:MAG: hypothetical protein M1820_001466 [Bogoriella megaspora]|nr:MAG: hypothetical protein M1820_001466 [Bogoriella megaspora]